MKCRYQAEFNIEKNESTPRGHLQDDTPWRKSLLARIRRERPVLLAAILSALAALAAGMNKWVVLVLLLVMILTALFNEAPIIAAE
ncbi:phosphate regulon sensor histidine kinase PhoR, partial [Rhizobium ruizarguesonis]